MSALGHLKVLDLSRVRAGPQCCRVLADFGADVIRVEPPAGIETNAGVAGDRHGSDTQNLQRNKRSITLDLKHPEGRALFLDLVAGADVVVENYRPGVKTRLGIDYAALSAVNPGIILASISGFGQDGPYADKAGFDQIAQGMGGLMEVTGFPDGPPTRAGTATADLSSGLYAATGILIALQERAQSGLGQWVQTSLLQAQIAMMDFQAARYLMDGDIPARVGNDHPTVAPMGVVETRDGHINLGVGGDGQWQALCHALEHPEWGQEARFARMDDRNVHRDEIWALLRPVFRTRTSAEWLALLDRYDVPAGPINRMDEVFADPQVQHLGMAQTVNHPVRGEVQLVAQPVVLSRTPATLRTAVAEAGEHTDEVLKEFGIRADRVARLRGLGVL